MSADRTESEEPEPVRDGETDEPGLIELESFSQIDTPRYVVHGQDDDGRGAREPEGPVPEKLLHLCPTCDYILAGLTSRRCPECGAPFTLADARGRAIDASPGMRRFYHRLVVGRIAGRIGIGLMVAAFAVPNFIGFSQSSRWWISVNGWVMLFMIGQMLLAGWILNYLFNVHWSRIQFAVGVAAAGIALFFIF